MEHWSNADSQSRWPHRRRAFRVFLFTRPARAPCVYLSPLTRRLPPTGRIEGENRPRRKIRTHRVQQDRSRETFRRRNAKSVSVAQRKSSPLTCRLRSKSGHSPRRKHKIHQARTALAVAPYSLPRRLPLLVLLHVLWMRIMMRVSPMHSLCFRSLTVRRCTHLRCPMAAGIQRHPHCQAYLIAGRSPPLAVVHLPLAQLL